ncbi:MAG: 3-dehydroquinate synthase [Chlamydiae bacterium]|nr:3-dehydroquinate synthase [Chlamydiota bacterium]
MKRQIQVTSSFSSYDVVIEEGLLSISETLKKYVSPLSSCFAIITDSDVGPLYARKLAEILHTLGFFSKIFTFPAGEKHKTRETKEFLEDQMLESGFGNDACVIALGGGVVSDVAGFLSSTYSRGIPWIIIPTSLLSMVDASIGGKCGVNTPFGKNLIGSVYHPKAVLMDLNVLHTLPLSEYKMGIVEMIKHGLIVEEEYFSFFEKNTKRLLQKEKETLGEAIYKSVCIKALIVQKEEKEKGIRNLLNFGHTVGHALETVSQNQLPHGLAVAMGIIAESYMATRCTSLSEESLERIIRIFHEYELDIFGNHSYSLQEIVQAMKYDKKSKSQVPHFVMIEKIGKSVAFEGKYCAPVDNEIVSSALQWMFARLEKTALLGR